MRNTIKSYYPEPKIRLRYMLLAAALALLVWQYIAYARAFDACQATLKEVKANLEILGTAIFELQIQMQN